MRIPLDYYRILGLPTQATAEQMQQAHKDRTMQLPRREYSEPAIAARRELLDEAYSVLSDAAAREKYDQTFLQQTASLSQRFSRGKAGTPQPHGIDVEDHQLIGALLLLQELGEYELVLELGKTHLAKMKSHNPGVGDAEMIAADVSLTIALSNLELGREQWQQSHYEEAAEALEAGESLLLQEGLFAGVRGEVRSDLYRLRPYRVLELISQPAEAASQRTKGIQVLNEMLHERGGIDGNGSDQSGLDTDDFLRFIQQLRDYLTVGEQQELFEQEARRPSAVASYLAVYALMARAFAEQKPDLALRAKRILSGLSNRQDVHLEQSVCALMLGQTEEANRALEFSQEYEPLAFIREHSQGSPDLLPGLCLYAERWLQDEVFPNFLDLKGQTTTLKDYFANPEVQNYLESLPTEAVSQDWQGSGVAMGSAWTGDSSGSLRSDRQSTAVGSASTYKTAGTATLAAPNGYNDNNDSHSNGNGHYDGYDGAGAVAAGAAGIAAAAGGAAIAYGNADNGTSADLDLEHQPSETRRQRRRRSRDGAASRRGSSAAGPLGSIKIGRLLMLAGVGLLTLWILFALLSQIFGWISGLGSGSQVDSGSVSSEVVTKLDKNQPSISLGEPVIDGLTPSNAATSVSATGPLSKTDAQQVIELWLSTKAEVFGSEPNGELLKNVLTGEALDRWAGEVRLSEQDGTEVRYQHKLAINEVKSEGTSPDEASVIATVTELAKYYQGDQLTRNREDRNLQVRYNLVKEDGNWKIKTMNVN